MSVRPVFQAYNARQRSTNAFPVRVLPVDLASIALMDSIVYVHLVTQDRHVQPTSTSVRPFLVETAVAALI